MKNEVFGEVKFNMGWETTIEITLFNNKYTVLVSVAAYFEKDGITKEQEDTYSEFLKNTKKILANIETKLLTIMQDEKQLIRKYVPTLLLVRRNGDCALLFDDMDDTEAGIAVTIVPDFEVLDQDAYL